MAWLAKFLSWSLQRLTLFLALLVVGVAGLGLWLFLREHVDFEQQRLELLRSLNGQNTQIRAALDDVELRITQLQSGIANAEQRASEAARIANDLESDTGGLNRITIEREQQRRNSDRLARLRAIESQAREEVKSNREKLARTEWERDGLKIALGKLDVQRREVERTKSKVLHYAREAWSRYGWHVVLVLVIWLTAPTASRLVAYFLVAPFISARRPVRLGESADALPSVTPSQAAIDLSLEPGDVLWIKESYLQASDEGLLKSTKWLLDWRMPFTCLAAGLREMVEMRNAAPDARLRVTCSSQESAQVELALVTVPARASLVLRPRFIAGFIGPVGRKAAAIRKHWRFFTLQAWATGQFRYFEFVGPCQLLLAGSRGVRAEVLEWSEGRAMPGRRTNQDATIGFTPGLAYRPVRAETFWAYFRGQNPLFDDLFEGRGIFLCQQTSAKESGAELPGFWDKFRDGLLRIFGL